MAQQTGKAPVNQDRRYVGSKETLGYVMFYASRGLNIDQYKDRFIYDVLKIDLYLLSVINTINSIWDVVNDTFMGAIVDKTRTRWGKFKPFLIATAIPGTIMTCLFWMMPLFFDDDPMNKGKFLIWLLLALSREAVATFRGVAETGMTATITPHPNDRTRLITYGNFFSGFFGTQIPEILMGILIDLINHKVISFSMQSTYVFMGVITTLGSGAMALYFFIITRERVVQSVEQPSIWQGVRDIIKNKPLLIIALTEFLGAFTLSAGMDNYYIDVLGSASIKNIVGVPGALVSPISYTYVPKLKQRFSTKVLWIVGGGIGDWLMGVVFFFGSIGGKGPNGWYRKVGAMIPLIMAQETLFMTMWGVRKVIPVEITNEAMDYFEWANGYRTEGMTSTALGLARKLVGTVSGSFRPAMMKMFGYDLKKGFGQQSDSTKYALFAMSTILPVVTGSFNVIPKLFYDLTGEKRERMYAELLARRAEKQHLLSQEAEEDASGEG